MTMKKKIFESTLGRGENAGNQHFLRFTQGFLPCQREIAILATFNFSPVYDLNLVTCTFGCHNTVYLGPHPDGSVVRVSHSQPGDCEFDPRLRRLFFPLLFFASHLCRSM